MPSQEEYLDNLLKGIENTAEEQGTETLPEETESESAEKNVPQIDMSDMDDLLQSALGAQQEDTKQKTQDKSGVIHPEETASMSEDDIDRLLQNSQQPSESVTQQGPVGDNDDLIKMLEDADDKGLSDILDQVTPEAEPEKAEEQKPEDNKREKKKREKKKKEKSRGFFARFQKKSKEEASPAPEAAIPEKVTEPVQEMPETDTAVDEATPETDNENTLSPESLTNAENSTESNETAASDNTLDSTGDNGIADDDLDALLAGAFPEKTEEENGTPEPADVMDILKAAGADIVEEPEQKKEKKGFFAKLLDLFTEEDEEEGEAEQIQLSDENKKILDEVDKDKKKKGKKEKKQKKEKPQKEKKPAKEKKKKEKPPKEKTATPEKKLSPKKVIPIVIVCVTLGAVILLLGNFLTEYMSRRSGREAYYAGDYQTCYQDLFGKDLNETEQIMYSKSESILTIRMWLREYDVFVNEGSELEALDSLLQAVHDYPSLLSYATEWNAQDEVTAEFQDILNILAQKYQLTQEEAQSIADISDNVEYTQNVMQILQNLGLGSWDFPEGVTEDATLKQNAEEAEEQLPDPLPEETEEQLQNMLPEETEEQLQNMLPEETEIQQ